jgi:hypothetical protein
MSRIARATLALLAVAAILAVRSASGQDADKKIYRNVTSERLEAVLEELGLKYTKLPGKSEGIHSYDFERNKFKVRLYNYHGKDLWIDAFFSDPLSLEEVNQWNSRAKFSRAVLIKANEKPAVSLESQLDCMGGVSDVIVRQFVRRFDGEVAQFVKFLAK